MRAMMHIPHTTEMNTTTANEALNCQAMNDTMTGAAFCTENTVTTPTIMRTRTSSITGSLLAGRPEGISQITPGVCRPRALPTTVPVETLFQYYHPVSLSGLQFQAAGETFRIGLRADDRAIVPWVKQQPRDWA